MLRGRQCYGRRGRQCYPHGRRGRQCYPQRTAGATNPCCKSRTRRRGPMHDLRRLAWKRVNSTLFDRRYCLYVRPVATPCWSSNAVFKAEYETTTSTKPSQGSISTSSPSWLAVRTYYHWLLLFCLRHPI